MALGALRTDGEMVAGDKVCLGEVSNSCLLFCDESIFPG